MRSIWPLAVITFKEGIRNRALYGISLFSLLLLGANLLISGMMMRSAGKTAVDMALSTVSLSGLLLVLFVGINLISKDLDRRTIYMVLARPISRSRYIVGKFLGMVLLILVTVAILTVVAALSILLVKAAYPDYFDRFSWPPVALAVGMIALMLVMLSAITFLFSSFASTSFITLALTIITYIIGNSISEVKALVETPGAISQAYEPSGVTVALVKTAYYLFPNLSFFDFKLQAAHGLVIPAATVAWTVAYGIVYTAIIILCAAAIFRRKEFP